MGRQVKGGAVHLGTAGIQRTEHSALTRVSSRQCFQGRDRRAERLPRERQPLDGGQTDAQPGKAAGACIDAVDVDISAGQMAEFETVVDQRHDRLAVGHACVEIALVQQAVILQQGHPRGLARGIHGQNVHSVTPSMVMRRVFSSTRWMSTRMGFSRASRSAKFSLHSAATMAP